MAAEKITTSLPEELIEKLDRVVFWSRKKHRSTVIQEALEEYFRVFELVHFEGKDAPPIPGL